MLSRLVPSSIRRLGPPLFVVLALAAAPAAIAAQGALHSVVITVNTQTGVLSYSNNPVVAFPGDRIMFSALGVDTWVVTFQGDTPFAGRTVQGRGGQDRIVPVLPNAAAGTYKYDVSVTVAGVTYTEDPEIVIRGRGDHEDPDPG